MMQTLARWLVKRLGWTLIEPAERPPRTVLIAYPHTSNWDALYALLARQGLALEAHWAAKDALFRWPFGGLLRRLGGVAVNRRQRTGFVDQMAAEFARRQRFMLVLAPEGTRSLTAGWKSGFYRIALAAQVPVGLGFIDYARRRVGILAYITLSGDPAQDIATIAGHYREHCGKRPELASPIRWLD
ncbi:1-acyl-sn-glycerol-3-phosphate acyltransferase [Azonexus hydrophilus]|uniref:1-acyl-sn-glycerol-3-phosphate acyltransferase n=1 Tax=Azonexus hydrophilus TaxID=418702 RepID=UPI002490A9C1|nr:1-acyl-sn-glycerol-3-phosphate acyltransferase [Azonexus hydrophilus]